MARTAQDLIELIAEAKARPLKRNEDQMNKAQYIVSLRKDLAKALDSMTADEIVAARKSLCLTQSQLADVMGLRGPAGVSEWENGVRQPDGRSVRLIRAYLDGYRPADWPS